MIFESLLCKKELKWTHRGFRWTGCADYVAQIGNVLQDVV